MLLAFILGPLMEENLRRALLLSRGDPSIFMSRPISLTLLLAAALLLALVAVPKLRELRGQAFQE
jgi:TctA family transporter